jgi:hypothetical protein
MLTGPSHYLDAIERQVLAADGPLLDALGQLSQLSAGRGACMCLEHRDLGITVIADAAWHHDGTTALQRRRHHSVFSLRHHAGFDTISVLVGAANEGELDMMMADCAIAAAAVDLVASVSEISGWPDGARRQQAA